MKVEDLSESYLRQIVNNGPGEGDPSRDEAMRELERRAANKGPVKNLKPGGLVTNPKQ